MVNVFTKKASAVDQAMSCLSRNDDEDVVISGIRHLPDQAAFLIRGCIGDVDLGSVQSISPHAALALSRHESRLDLGGLEVLTVAVAEGLCHRVEPQKRSLALNGVREIDEDEAAAIAQYRGDLELDGLLGICEQVAARLSSHQGRLSLNGLVALNRESASWLASHEGDISLHGLETLSDECAHEFSKHPGKISLAGLTEVTPAAVQVLAQSIEHLFLCRVTHLNEAAAEALAAVRRERSFNDGQITLPVRGHLFLTGLRELSAEVACHLSRFYGAVNLEGVKLSPEVAVIMKKNAHGIDFGHLSSLSEKDAVTVSGFDGPLNLAGLRSLDRDVAARLAKHIDGTLYLDGLTELADGVAEALRAHTGPLSLNGLRELSCDAAGQFATHRDRLSLNGLESLSVDCARLLAKRKFATEIKGLQHVDAAVSEIVAAMPR
jgi:hypothetical protein